MQDVNTRVKQVDVDNVTVQTTVKALRTIMPPHALINLAGMPAKPSKDTKGWTLLGSCGDWQLLIQTATAQHKAHMCKYVLDRGPKLCASENSTVFMIGKFSVICCLLLDAFLASKVNTIMIHAYGFKSHPSWLSELTKLLMTGH